MTLKWRYDPRKLDPTYHAQGKAGHFEIMRDVDTHEWYLYVEHIQYHCDSILHAKEKAQAIEDEQQ